MAKRFTDTELYDKPWFMLLSCRLKCAVEYLFKKCDATGVWEPNYILAAAYVGEGGFTEQELLSIDGGNQFEKLRNGKIFIAGFCAFQYGELTESCRPHRPIIQKLKKHGLYERVLIGYQKGTNTLEEKDKEKDKEKEQEEGGTGETIPQGIVPDMLQTFKLTNPGYPIDQAVDFPALLCVGNKIVAWQKLPGDITGAKNVEVIKSRWGELVPFIRSHTLFGGYSLAQVNKHFQSIVQSFNSAQNGNKQKGNTTTKQTPSTGHSGL